MKMPRSRQPLMLALVAATIACDDPTQPLLEAEQPTPPDNGSVVFLEVTPPQPQPGDSVVVTIRGRTDQLGNIGAFRADIVYDGARLRFVRKADVSTGMTAHNAGELGRIRVAGAAPTGFADGVLFRAQFVAVKSRPEEVLALQVYELYSDRDDHHERSLKQSLLVLARPVFVSR